MSSVVTDRQWGQVIRAVSVRGNPEASVRYLTSWRSDANALEMSPRASASGPAASDLDCDPQQHHPVRRLLS
ncbi:MAG TPA: hypothetical protein VFO06_02690, partial [Gemmatimonadales bacterium]|nr:hypothetical protein [Gemmatimonadales bacterium]